MECGFLDWKEWVLDWIRGGGLRMLRMRATLLYLDVVGYFVQSVVKVDRHTLMSAVGPWRRAHAGRGAGAGWLASVDDRLFD